MAVSTIVHFEIPANDVETLARFYRRCFGWTFEKAPMPGFDYWLISTGPRGKSVGGGMFQKMGPQDGPRNYIAVERIDEAIARFRAAGGSEIVGKMEVPGQGWSFIGADTEGNVLALWEAARAPRAPRTARSRRRSPAKRRAAAHRPRRRA